MLGINVWTCDEICRGWRTLFCHLACRILELIIVIQCDDVMWWEKSETWHFYISHSYAWITNKNPYSFVSFIKWVPELSCNNALSHSYFSYSFRVCNYYKISLKSDSAYCSIILILLFVQKFSRTPFIYSKTWDFC